MNILWIAGLKRPSAQDDSGPLIKINRAELELLQSDPSQPALVESAEPKHCGVLIVGGDIISANPEQQERFHVPHPTRLLAAWPPVGRSARRQLPRILAF